MKLRRLIGLGWALLALGAAAQLVADPDWKEAEAGAPPSFNKDRVIAIEMPHYVSLRIGVDPATLSIGEDGVVRYVVIATSTSGLTSAIYEGIRCSSAEVKTFARSSSGGQWTVNANQEWRDLNGRLPSKHALALVRQGLCDGRSAPAGGVPAIINTLKHPYPAQPR